MGTADDDTARFNAATDATERANTPRFVTTNFGSTAPTGRWPGGAPTRKRVSPSTPRPVTAPDPPTVPPLVSPVPPPSANKRPPFLSSTARPPFSALSSARRQPGPVSTDPNSLGSASGALLWHAARLAEERRVHRQQLAALEARHEAAQRDVQALRMQLAAAPQTHREGERQDDAYERVKRQLGRAGEERWKAIASVSAERDAALEAVAAAQRDSERQHNELVLLRGEVARLRAAAGAASHGGGADGAGGGAARRMPRPAAEWSTIEWLETQPDVCVAVGAALMASLPRGALPAAVKTIDDHSVERALLVAQAETFDARTGPAALADMLADGEVGRRLASALWPAVEALARE
jgi:hypothetical protein